MLEFLTITLALMCVVLLFIIFWLDEKHDEYYEELVLTIEEERSKRNTEKLCRDLFFEHYKQQKDKEIALLREALHNSEKKRKELCTRLWEEEKTQ